VSGVSKSASAEELRALLREGLAARLSALGWVKAPGRAFTLAAFVRPLGEDLAATAEIDMASSLPDRPPVRLTRVTVGVAYEPLRRLWPLLGDLVSLHALAEEAVDDEWELEVWGRGDVPAAVETLAAIVIDRAVPFAERYASLDAVIAERRGDDLISAALLAAAHRFAEADAALAAHPYELSRDQKRFVRQLRRFIDSGGDESLVPDEPPPRPERSPRPPVKELWRQIKAANEAADTVRDRCAGRPREEQRAMLEAELARRGIADKSPLWIEQTLDHLWDSPASRAAQTVAAVRAVGRLGRGVVRFLRDDLPEFSPPGWLEPPVHAAYVHDRFRDEGWTAVALDEHASDWLRDAYAATPRIGASALLDAWLDAGRAVHLGERRVGTIDDARADALVALAVQRDELPCVRARLTPRPRTGGYLLEVGLP
jgi:hypothetical protein